MIAASWLTFRGYHSNAKHGDPELSISARFFHGGIRTRKGGNNRLSAPKETDNEKERSQSTHSILLLRRIIERVSRASFHLIILRDPNESERKFVDKRKVSRIVCLHDNGAKAILLLIKAIAIASISHHNTLRWACLELEEGVSFYRGAVLSNGGPKGNLEITWELKPRETSRQTNKPMGKME